jgi:hypothetical protein
LRTYKKARGAGMADVASAINWRNALKYRGVLSERGAGLTFGLTMRRRETGIDPLRRTAPGKPNGRHLI